MKIGLTVDSKAYGGIEAHICELANALHKQGINVTIIRLNHYTVEHPLRDKCARLNIPYIELDGNVLQYYRYISNHNFSLIHSHGYKANILNKVGKLFCSYRAVCTYHSGDQGRGKVFLYDASDRYTAWLANYNIAVSQTIQSSLLGSSELLHNAVSTQNIALCCGQKIGFVGRLSKEKGPERFIAISRHFPDQQFIVFGDGPEMDSLRHNLPPNVTLAGHQSEMDSVWSQISLLIMPSRAEGLPLACLEAMIRGIPTLTSALGSLPQVIDHKKNGYLLAEFSVNDFVKTLNEWIKLPEIQKTSMRELARTKIMNYFSIDKYAMQMQKIYLQVLNTDIKMSKGKHHG